jgi:hemerythrin-like domain-containing protein
MHTPTQTLKDEHRVIELVLDAVEARLAELGRGPFPRQFFEEAVDFLVNFADGCHHAKEEKRLFPLLEQRGIPRQGGPIGCMLKEHVEGRAFIAGIRQNLDAAARGEAAAIEAVAQNASGYVALLRSHITKEDTVLFRLADHILSAQDVAQLQQGFEEAEREEIGPGVHEKYEALARRLSDSPALATL